MSSRTETFHGASAVDVTTTADPISIDTTATGPIVVTLVPEVPGDKHAEERIQRAEVRASGGTVIVDVPANTGGTVSGSGVVVTGNGNIVSGGGIVAIQGNVVSGNVVHQSFGGTFRSGGDMHFGRVSVSGHGNVVSNVYGNVRSGPTHSGGGVFVGGNAGGGGVRVLISAPSGANIAARTTSGSITHRGTAGAARVESVSGAIRMDTITGRASLESTSGKVSVSSLAGGGSVETVSGAVMVHVPADGSPVAVETVSGAITRSGATHLIAASSVSGRIR